MIEDPGALNRDALNRDALAWLTRVNDAEFEDWDALEAWLAEDPRHAETYWRLAEAEAEVVERWRAERPVAAVVRRAASTSRRARWPGWAAAAAVAVLAFGGWMSWSQRPQPWLIETAPGERREVALDEGSRVTLDGASRVTLDRRHPRSVRLEEGRALFHVAHDETRPFLVTVGETKVTDLGTVFDVTRLSAGVRVAVAEGLVRVELQGRAADLSPGQAVLATDRALTRSDVDPQAVTGWPGGRLSYRAETLAVVADDLSRALGLSIAVDPGVADRVFTGGLSVEGASETLRPRLELLLDVRISPTAEGGWRMEPKPSP